MKPSKNNIVQGEGREEEVRRWRVMKLLEWNRRSGARWGSSGQEGLTLIEVAIATAVSAVLMLATSAAISSGLGTVGMAEDLTDASVLLQTVSEELELQSYDDLLAMNGNRIFEGADEDDSSIAVDMQAFETAVDLIQVRLAVVDLRSDREIGRVLTLRARR